MNPLSTLASFWSSISDASAHWDEAIDRLEDSDRTHPALRRDYIVDVRADAAGVRYRPSKRRRALGLRGRVKRTVYRPVDLSARRVVLMVHQTGVLRTPAQLARRAHLVTAQEVFGPDGTVFLVHPDEIRLIASNRLDRDPYHSINFEFAGNFEGVAGSGRYFNPEQLGRSTMTAECAAAASARITGKVAELRQLGIEPFMIAPHRIAGRDQWGNPNRQICCGSAAWKVAETVAARTGVPVPGHDYKIGGLPIPPSWRSEYFAECRTVDA